MGNKISPRQEKKIDITSEQEKKEIDVISEVDLVNEIKDKNKLADKERKVSKDRNIETSGEKYINITLLLIAVELLLLNQDLMLHVHSYRWDQV